MTIKNNHCKTLYFRVSLQCHIVILFYQIASNKTITFSFLCVQFIYCDKEYNDEILKIGSIGKQKKKTKHKK